MSWFEDNVVDPVSDFVGNVISDPLGAFGDYLGGYLNFITLGAAVYLKDKLQDYVQGLVPEQDYQDRERTVRSGTEPRQVIYGKARVGGQLVYVEDQGKDNVILWLCYVLAGHECEEIETVYADGEAVATSNGPGVNGVMNRPSNPFGDNIVCWSIHGNLNQAFIPSVTWNYTSGGYTGTFSPPNWTVDHKLVSQTYVWISLAFDEEEFGDTGLPRFTFDVKGKNDLYDPRTGMSGYSDNQGLAMLDVLLWGRMFDEDLGSIDADSFIDAANVADELVASGVGTTEKRYTVNGTFKLQAVPLEILKSIATAGSAYPYFDVASGKWRVVPGAYQAPAMPLDESDLVGGISFQPGPPKNSRKNSAKGTFIDASNDYEPTGFEELNIAAYVDDDLEVLEETYDFPWTNSGTMARRLAKIDIERNRYGVSCNAIFKFKAARLTPGDRVELTVSRLGWSPKVFRVEAVEMSFEKGVALDLREDAPEIYSWEEGDALALDPPPTLSIPGGVSASPPADIEFEEELYQALTRSAVKVQLTISWTDQPSANAYDIQYRLTGATTWIDAATFWQDNNVTLLDVKDEPYEFRVRAINGIGKKSDWTTASYSVIGKSAPPPDVDLLFVEKRVLKWTYPSAPLDLSGFLVRFQNGDRQFWADATPAHEGIVTETIFDVSEFSGTKTFLVKAVDTTGNVSDAPAILVQGLGDVPVQNVVDEQNEAPLWAGTLTGGFVNPDDHLESNEIGSFYGDPESIFYNPDPDSDFYGTEYERLEYEWTFTVAAADVGASLTVEEIISGDFNDRIDYKPPGFTGDPLAFPGAVAAEEGTYTFYFAIPQQALPSPPVVEDIITRLDVEDIQERLGNVVIAAGGTRLPIVRDYREIVVVNLTLQDDGGTASTIKILDKDETLGPLVQAFDDSGTAVSATVDALIQGF